MSTKTKKNQLTVIQPKKSYSALNYENEWTHTLFDCCSDMKICCWALWCLPCYACEVFTDAREFLGTVTYPHSLANLRTKIRATYRIKGMLDSDALVVFFCTCCALIQMKKELIAHNEAKR